MKTLLRILLLATFVNVWLGAATVALVIFLNREAALPVVTLEEFEVTPAEPPLTNCLRFSHFDCMESST